jgi:hypothetical protein
MTFIPLLCQPGIVTRKLSDILAVEKKDNRCQHLPPVDEDSKMIDFRDQILVLLLILSNVQTLICLFSGIPKRY